MRRLAAIAVVALAAVLVAAACTSDDDGTDGGADAPADGSARGGTLRLGVADLATLDPALVVPTEPGQMIAADLLFDALTVTPEGVDDGGDRTEVPVQPDVAESMTPDADHVVWTVRLADRQFSDGSPITAADVKHSLERVAAQGSDALSSARLELVDGYPAFVAGTATELSGLRVVNEATLEITLREPYVDLPLLLSSPVYGVVPRSREGASDPDQPPVGSGPYRVVEMAEERTRLERAPGVAGESVGPDAVELVEFDSSDSSYRAFVDGQVDWSLVPPTQDALREATNAYTGDAFEFFGGTIWLGINPSGPSLQDARFREAIIRAVSSDNVVGESLPGRWPLQSIVPRGVPGYSDDACAAACTHDPALAASLVREAFPDGAVPVLALDGYDDPTQRALLESVKADLAEAGIPADVRLRPLGEYQQFLASGQQGVFSYGWVGMVPTQDLYLGPVFMAGAPDNVTGVQLDLVNGLISRARATPDPVERVALYRDAERAVMELRVVVPIAQLRTNQVISERVEGFETRLDGTFVVESVRVSDG